MTHWIWQYPEWPHFSWQESTVLPLLAEARHHQGRLWGAAQLLDEGLSMEAQVEILVKDGINTSAIEGERINVDSIRSSIARRLGLPTAGLPVPPRAVDGLVEVLLDATTRYSVPLTVKRLCGWQAALFPTGYSGLYPIKTGALRGEEPMRIVSGPIGREKIHFEAPPRNQLVKMFDQFITWFNESPKDLDGLLRTSIAHLWFVIVHPFEDGNGRLARAITDMAIAQDEQRSIRLFSLSTQIMKNRKGYYDVLEKTTSNGLDITAWLSWFLTQITLACQSAEGTVISVLAKARFWLRHKHTVMNDRQLKVINRLLDAGIEGFVGDMNTRKYMSLTKTSRATAYRELDNLVEQGCLVRLGSGRSVNYKIHWEDE